MAGAAADEARASDEAYVLRVVCEWLIERDVLVIDPVVLFRELNVGTMAEWEVREALEQLVRLGYIAPTAAGYRVTGVGFGRYVRSFFDRYESVVERVAGAVVVDEMRASDVIAWELRVPHRVIVHALSELEAAGHVKLGGRGAAVARVLAVSTPWAKTVAAGK